DLRPAHARRSAGAQRGLRAPGVPAGSLGGRAAVSPRDDAGIGARDRRALPRRAAAGPDGAGRGNPACGRRGAVPAHQRVDVRGAGVPDPGARAGAATPREPPVDVMSVRFWTIDWPAIEPT